MLRDFRVDLALSKLEWRIYNKSNLRKLKWDKCGTQWVENETPRKLGKSGKENEKHGSRFQHGPSLQYMRNASNRNKN